jgi:hypothetical protein
MCSHLFCYDVNVQTCYQSNHTNDKEKVGICALHFRCGTRIFISNEVLRIDDGHDRVQLQPTRRLALKLPYLEGESGGEGRSSVDSCSVSTHDKKEVGTHEHSMMMRSGLKFSV